MRDFDRRRQASTMIVAFSARVAALVLLIGLSTVAVHGTWRMYARFRESVEAERLARSDLASLQEQQVRVATAVAALSTERGVEAEVRERYGVVRPGEGEITVVRDTEATTTDQQESSNPFVRVLQSLFVW